MGEDEVLVSSAQAGPQLTCESDCASCRGN